MWTVWWTGRWPVVEERPQPLLCLEGKDHQQRDRGNACDHGEAQHRQDDEADQAQDRLQPDARWQARQELEELPCVHCAHFFSKSHTSEKPMSSCMPRYCGTLMSMLVPFSLRCCQAWRIASAATLKPSPGYMARSKPHCLSLVAATRGVLPNSTMLASSGFCTSRPMRSSSASLSGDSTKMMSAPASS